MAEGENLQKLDAPVLCECGERHPVKTAEGVPLMNQHCFACGKYNGHKPDCELMALGYEAYWRKRRAEENGAKNIGKGCSQEGCDRR